MAAELKIGTALISIHQASVVYAGTEAIVNAANDKLAHGGGLCGAIYAAAGPELDKYTSTMGGCPTGQAKITPAFNLTDSQYIIHAVGPVYQASQQARCRQLLASAYHASLELADKQGLKSIGLPSLSTGIYGYPLDKAAPVAVQAVVDYLHNRTDASLTEVKFYMFQPEEYDLFSQALAHLAANLTPPVTDNSQPPLTTKSPVNTEGLPIADCYWVIPPMLLAGEYPGAAEDLTARERLEKFVQAGIRVFVDLTRPDDRYGKGLNPYNPLLQKLAIDRDLQLTYINSPIRDRHIPTETQMNEILALIELYTHQQKPVYVHCWGGIGRTGTVVSCYLIDKQGLSWQEAIKEMNRLRSKTPDGWRPSPQEHSQEQFIQNWALKHNSSPSQAENKANTKQEEAPLYFYEKDQPFYSFTNFAPYGFELDGYYWKTSEHYFQAQKFVGTPYFDEIRQLEWPSQVFKRAQELKDQVPSDWFQVRDKVMRKAVLRKFETNPTIKAELLGTGSRPLVEDSPVDSYWGIGKAGKGQNRLGQILMEVRQTLREQSSPKAERQVK
jgi:ribA/ribD-fused uncharacterized protein